MSLGDYTKPLISESLQWITFLTLSNITISRRDLINLKSLDNIGVLTIGDGVLTPDVGLEDGVVRAWGRAAAEADAFSLLRALNLRHQREVTPRLFQYLHSFPSLSLFNLDDCSLGHRDKQVAMTSGWMYKTGRMLNESLPELGQVDATWDTLVHACFRAGGTCSVESMTSEGVEAINSLPVLHCAVGAGTSNARLNASGNYKLQCFERVAKWSLPQTNSFEALKRPIDAVATSKDLCAKKPKLRASKQQSVGDLFNGFGP